ncbi:MAG: CidA/LrgA family protein [Cardiobacteriaceae bacterium]|nr:CidA/LrgA family protein [Cardiobacteriaceae bacterium]
MNFIISCLLIYLSLIIGNILNSFIPLPSSILGMLFLYFLLLSRKIPEKYTAPVCVFLMKYMVLLFVPVSVGIIAYWNEMKTALLPISMACILGSIILIITVGFIVEIYERRINKTNIENSTVEVKK